MKNIYFIVFSIIIILYILYSIRKNKISVNNSTVWILFCVALLALSIWPKSLDWLASAIGIDYPPALYLTIAVVILFTQNFVYSKRIEMLEKKVTNLSQESSIMKEKLNEKK